MTKTMIPVAALGALLGACTEVPNLAEDVCGNRIVDRNEDCDGFSGMGEHTACGAPSTSNACFFVCAGEAADGAPLACPEGWGCGLDGRCRQASGRFGPDADTAFRFQASSAVLGDLDGDGFPELVGQRGAQLSVRFGAASGDFPVAREVPVPEPLGALSFGLFDDDSLLDVVVPIAGGLIALMGRENRELEPVSYSSLALADTKNGVRALTLDAFPLDQNSEVLAMIGSGMRFFENSSNAYLPFPDANGSLDTLVDALASGDVDGDDRDEFVLAFEGSSTVHLCEAGISNGDERTLQPLCAPIPSLPGPILDFGTHLTDVDGDGDLDLLAAVSGSGDGEVAVAVALQDTGSFVAPAVDDVFAQRREDIVFNFCEAAKEYADRSNAWPLAAADFNRDGRADYVFEDAIALARGSVPGFPTKISEVACITSGRWKEAVVADFNGDGWPDVAVSFADIAGIDVYLNGGDGAGGELFNKFHVNTGKSPEVMRIGDFDGDRVQDVAYYEPGLGGELDRVFVIFGSASAGPSAPVAMGAFPGIDIFEPMLSPFEALNGRDFITDLVVVSLPPGTPATDPPPAVDRAASILQGDSSRRMLSPMFLTNSEGSAEQPVGALFGHFIADEGEQVRDLAAISLKEGAGSGSAELTSNLWLLAGIDGSGALQVPREPAGVLPPDLGTFDYTCALWAAGNLDAEEGDPLDEVVGIDRSVACRGTDGAVARSRILVASPAELVGDGSALTPLSAVELGDGYAYAQSMSLHDLDGDGRQDILVAFAGGQDGAGAAVVALWNQGGAFSPDAVTIFPAPNGEAVVDAAAVQLGGDGAPELLVLTRERVYAARLDPQSRQYLAGDAPLLELPADDASGDGRLRVADVDGDGLDDIVLLRGGSAQIFLQGPQAPLGSAPLSALGSSFASGAGAAGAAAGLGGGR